MQTQEVRQATGTPIETVLEEINQDHRIANLERQIVAMRAEQNRLWCALAEAAITDINLAGRLERIEGGDLRLTEVLTGIERKLRNIGLGGEVLP